MKNKRIAVITITFFSLFIISYLTNCKKDKDDPVIKLIGASPYKIPLNSTYIEPGYSASDDKDGDITDKVNVTDSIDVNQVGTYIVEYSVKDEKGNKTTEERKVVVYNEAEEYAKVYLGTLVFPAPGTEPVDYIDTIKYSETVNNELIFTNFANNLGINLIGTVEPISIYGPIVEFEEQSTSIGTFSFDFDEDEDMVSQITLTGFMIYFKLNSGGETNTGELLLKRY